MALNASGGTRRTRAGGTLVVQYQQNEVQRPGVVPYPMTVARPHDRVTIEEAPVTVVDPTSPLLAGPNRITAADFDGWVQERSLYMPRTFDERYAAPLEMHDPGEDPRRGALLVAPLGQGTYVYTALSFFRQIPVDLSEAAQIDGASWWQTQWRVTIPLLGPTIRMWIFLSMIGSLQLFDMVWILTGGGPANATTTMATFLVNEGTKRQNFGIASAASVVLFVIALVMAVLYQRFVLRRDTADADVTRGVR